MLPYFFVPSPTPPPRPQVIPFLKTYVNLPGAILFTVIYSKMSNAVRGLSETMLMLTIQLFI